MELHLPMGTETINIPSDELPDHAVKSTENGTSNLYTKSSSVDVSIAARRDFWGPRLFGKTGESKVQKELKGSKESKELKEPKESKENDVKEITVTNSVEVFPIDHDKKQEVTCEINLVKDAQALRKDMNPEFQKPIDHGESDSPNDSTPKPANNGIAQPFSHPTEKHTFGGNGPSTDCSANGKKPAKINNIQSSDMPKKEKRSPIQATRKPMHPDIAMHTDEEDGSSPSSIPTSVKYPRAHTTVATAPIFRCDERAEKRREFYAILEQKRQALEAERLQCEARTKEEMEAALKQLRKSLVIKATPMPSFYQEGPPPTVDIKKTPPTRAKSPKLSRRKSLNDANYGDNNGICYRLARHSLDSNNEVIKKLHNGKKIVNANAASKAKEKPKSAEDIE